MSLVNDKKEDSAIRFYIDKTEILEKGIGIFPSIFLEGSAASGKTTAVKMLLEKHPSVIPVFLYIEEKCEIPQLKQKLEAVLEQMRRETVWLIFENMNTLLLKEVGELLRDLIQKLPRGNEPQGNKVIMVSREKPSVELLDLFWKKQMDIIPQRALLFTEKDTRLFCESKKCVLDPREVYDVTGGWAGCVEAMITLASKREGELVTAQELREQYEIDGYISAVIIDSLKQQEKELLCNARMCPWLSVDLCEDVWGFSQSEEKLKNLERKGFLISDKRNKRWKAAPLFREKYAKKKTNLQISWKTLGDWYEKNGYIKEAIFCIQTLEEECALQECLIRNYDKVPFLSVSYEQVMKWEDTRPEACYLRGMYSYHHKNMADFEKEIQRLQKQKTLSNKAREIYLNLIYLKPDLSLDKWLEILEDSREEQEPVRLYDLLGGACSCLCGYRDLSGMFACSKKEENRKKQIWKTSFDQETYLWLKLAYIDYQIEIGQEKSISETDKNLLCFGTSLPLLMEEQMKLARMYLLCRLWKVSNAEEYLPIIRQLEEELLHSDDERIQQKTDIIRISYFSKLKDSREILQWAKKSALYLEKEIKEENHVVFDCLAREYLRMRQYDKAEKIFRKLIPYLREFHRYRPLTEVLFEQAIVSWEKDSHSQALRYVIESFIANGEFRYVRSYTDYGKSGYQMLETYVDWVKSTLEGWHRKKKYNYGDVRRMPQEDYLELLLRMAKRRSSKKTEVTRNYPDEHLTMMETVILQNISDGKSNVQIGEELNLKLPTVKSHIYNLYKKLGVNSRIQAVLKGKEMGILKEN